MKLNKLTLCITSAISLSSLPISASEIIGASMTQEAYNALYPKTVEMSEAAKQADLKGLGWGSTYDKETDKYYGSPTLITDDVILDDDAIDNSSPYHKFNAISANNNRLVVVGTKGLYNIPYTVDDGDTAFGTPIKTKIQGEIVYKAMTHGNMVLTLEMNELGKLDWPLDIDDYRAANKGKNVFKGSTDEQNMSVCRLYDSSTTLSKTIPSHSCAFIKQDTLPKVIAIGTTYDNPTISGYNIIGTDELDFNMPTLDTHSLILTEDTRRSRKLLSEVIPELATMYDAKQHATIKNDNMGNVYVFATAYTDKTFDDLRTFVYKTSDGITWSNVTDQFYDSPNQALDDAEWPSDIDNGRSKIIPEIGRHTYDFMIHPDTPNVIIYNAFYGTGSILSNDPHYQALVATGHSDREAFVALRNAKLITQNNGISWEIDSRRYGTRSYELAFLDTGDGYYLPTSFKQGAFDSGFAFARYGESPSIWYDYNAIGSFEMAAYDTDNHVFFTADRRFSSVKAFSREDFETFYTWPLAETVEPTPEATPEPTVAPSSEPKETDDEVKKSGGGGGSFGFISLLALGIFGLTRRK